TKSFHNPSYAPRVPMCYPLFPTQGIIQTRPRHPVLGNHPPRQRLVSTRSGLTKVVYT
ncbi:hypothetical protein BJ165DRAFT_1517839, partial [Panaeolus papilionaceus]